MQLVFEWDDDKARVNQAKHGVDFDEAKTVFGDPFILTFPDDEHLDVEERSISIGYSGRRRALLVVHADDEGKDVLVIWIISCRRATATERRTYEEY